MTSSSNLLDCNSGGSPRRVWAALAAEESQVNLSAALTHATVKLAATNSWLNLSQVRLLIAFLLATALMQSCHLISPVTAAPTNTPTHSWQLITRAEWQARPPRFENRFTDPAPYVILHHSYQPGVCHTTDACKSAMRSMQNYHMDSRKWADIGYSFAVGGDGNVYEGRGFNVVGAHAPNYNKRSIGLLLIGNFVDEAPPASMLHTAQSFIEYAVAAGKLSEDYVLYGHRQVTNTVCPGGALYALMQKWPHWQQEV